MTLTTDLRTQNCLDLNLSSKKNFTFKIERSRSNSNPGMLYMNVLGILPKKSPENVKPSCSDILDKKKSSGSKHDVQNGKSYIVDQLRVILVTSIPFLKSKIPI